MNESTNENTATSPRIHKPGVNILYPELSYELTGIFFEVKKRLGRFAREKQYCDLIETLLKEHNILRKREFTVPNTGNRLDFTIDDKIILEIKAKQFIDKAEYFQTRRYLDILNLELGLLVNFHDKYLKPQRVLRAQSPV
jgi:GxxExxY protein